jgi:hypothetical protein
MTQIKKRAIKLINGMNDEKLMTLITFVENLRDETAARKQTSNDTEKRLEAFNRLVGLTAENPVTLEEAREERLSKQ